MSSRLLAEKLGVAPSTINRVRKKQSGIRPEMALRLSKAIGRSPDSWLAMQDTYDLWQARQTVDLDQIEKLDFAICHRIYAATNNLLKRPCR